MKDRILQTLSDLRAYALQKGVDASFVYHEEESYLMRFANSAISLNTSEHLIRLDINTFDGTRTASYEMITDLDSLAEMKKGVDIAAEMVKHATPLKYQPTIPEFKQSFEDQSGYDPELAGISGEERLAYFNRAAQGLESDEIKLSGIFNSGGNIVAQISTRSPYTQFFRMSDAQINLVLAHSRLKWEVLAEQSAHRKDCLNPATIHNDLAFLLDQYQHSPAQQIPVGKYDIVFGEAAIGDLLSFMNWIGINGGSMKRGFSFLTQEHLGKQVFSDRFSLFDDPTCSETFSFRRDLMGVERKPFTFIEQGVFKAFAWNQTDADEFGQQPTGHHVPHKSLVLQGGDVKAPTLQDLVAMPREKDLLYIPYLHYMNMVNPSRGLVTGSSRFGALLLKQDGSVVVPYNVRLTQSLLDIFGERIAWLSTDPAINNTSMSYGARNPTALVVPAFIRVNELEISHSNTSY